ncbi:uncharacterized protein V6R79_015686 [Siganus canaliculatus]
MVPLTPSGLTTRHQFSHTADVYCSVTVKLDGCTTILRKIIFNNLKQEQLLRQCQRYLNPPLQHKTNVQYIQEVRL